MKIGTKSLLFGAHWPAHNAAVILAWRWLYGTWPSIREAAAILIHDIGYLGCPDLDGPRGTRHPELGARIAGRLLGQAAGDLVAGHSAGFATWAGVPRSRLYGPDKVSVAFEAARCYVARTRATGELALYRSTDHACQPRPDDPSVSDLDWFRITRLRMIRSGIDHALDLITPASLKPARPATYKAAEADLKAAVEALDWAVKFTTQHTGRPLERWEKARDTLADLIGIDVGVTDETHAD